MLGKLGGLRFALRFSDKTGAGLFDRLIERGNQVAMA